MSIDLFYPISETIKTSAIWQISMLVKLETHLQNAQNGNRLAESKLINRIGQIRRNVESFNSLNSDLQDVIKRSVEWLRTTGRTVDLKNENPALWITMRDGSPRWQSFF
jgi:hypothetical protein